MDTPKTGFRQQIFAWALARSNTRYERFAAKYKQRLFRDLTGTILEIGPGTGANLRYLNPANGCGTQSLYASLTARGGK
jgi:hypothetical protein